MNKLLLLFLSTLLVVLLAITGVLLYAFSANGNDVIKGYIQSELQSKMAPLAVDVRKFTLDAGSARMIVDINHTAKVEIVTQYDMLHQSFQGIYHMTARNFTYNQMFLRQAQVKGHFQGNIEDVFVDGMGTALDAPLSYRFRVLEGVPQKIEAAMKGISLAEVLGLLAQPPLAEGKMDIDINMPDIGTEFANGYGHIILHKAQFDRALVTKIYDLPLPKSSYVTAKVDVKLKGDALELLADAQSNLFHLKVKEASLAMKEKRMQAHYFMDVKEMAILSKNRLSGALKVEGDVHVEGKKYQIKGATNSLGGTLLFDVAEVSKLHFENLKLSKILQLLKQPVYASGLLSGSGDIDKTFTHGRYDIQIEKGHFDTKNIKKHFAYDLPSVNDYSLQSEGKIVDKVLKAKGAFKSSVSDLTLTKLSYEIEKKKLQTDYALFLPDIGLLLPENKAVKRGYMSAKGLLKFDKTLYITGSTSGLGEQLDFIYDGKRAKVDARDLFVEKLLSLSALPRYVKGKLSSSIVLTDVKNMEGNFHLHSKKLTTQSHVMERVLGKKLAMNLSLESKGRLKKAMAYVTSTVDTDMGKLQLDDMVVNTKTSAIKSAYRLEIPALQKAEVLLGKKLYGALLLTGEIHKEKQLNVTGETNSLGGNIAYTLNGDILHSTLKKVSVDKILTMLGHKPLVQGEAFGTMVYNLKSKKGTLDIDIQAFQIKSSSTTKSVKMFIGKDPARIIYKTTKLHAEIDADVTRYTLIAKGARSQITIRQGVVDKVKDTHRAKFEFVYEKYVVTGSIGGSVEHPSVRIDPSSIMQSKAGEKIQNKLNKALGGDMGQAVGGFLKGLKF